MFVSGRVYTDLYHTLPLPTRDALLRLADRLTSIAARGRGRRNRVVCAHVRAALAAARAGV